jgi:hypothetical protein
MVSITTSSARVDTDVLEAAKAAGAVVNRSASQQLSYWARLGKQLEESNALSPKAITRVLAGKAPYDDLGEFDQAAVRAAWEESIDDAIGDLDYEDRLLAAGESWAEADDQGNLVIRNEQSAG